MQGKYISIIIPVYNGEKYLDYCIESVLAQTYMNYELVLVDDGSKDSSGEKCDIWEKKDKRIKVVHKENGGLVSAWSIGVSVAKYEWIVFLDSDDWLEYKHLEMIIKEQEKNNTDMVVMRMKQMYPEYFVYLDFVVTPGNYREEKLEEIIYPVMLNAGGFEKRGIPISRCSKLIKKSLILQNMKYCDLSVTYEEDLSIMFPIMLDINSVSLICAENASYCYRVVEDSMLHGYDKNMQRSIQLVYKNIFKACLDKKKQNFFPQIYAEYLTAMVRSYTNELQNPEGFRKIKKNIKGISEDVMLQNVIKQVDWSSYPLKFKVVIMTLSKFNWFNANIITRLLMLIRLLEKKIRIYRTNEGIK